MAYQFGDVVSVGFLFSPFVYGDNGVDTSTWAGDLVVGYTFDYSCKPRVFIGGAYYGGEDNRDVSFVDWLEPFYQPDASLSFNRLFCSRSYSVDEDRNSSNFNEIRVVVSIKITDSVNVSLALKRYRVNATFDMPMYWRVGRFRVPLAPGPAFWTTPADNGLGCLTGL